MNHCFFWLSSTSVTAAEASLLLTRKRTPVKCLSFTSLWSAHVYSGYFQLLNSFDRGNTTKLTQLLSLLPDCYVNRAECKSQSAGAMPPFALRPQEMCLHFSVNDKANIIICRKTSLFFLSVSKDAVSLFDEICARLETDYCEATFLDLSEANMVQLSSLLTGMQLYDCWYWFGYPSHNWLSCISMQWL